MLKVLAAEENATHKCFRTHNFDYLNGLNAHEGTRNSHIGVLLVAGDCVQCISLNT